MIRAMALKPAVEVTDCTHFQNMNLRFLNEESCPLEVEEMAMKMLDMYEDIEDVISAFYRNDGDAEAKFKVSMHGKTKCQRQKILSWLEDLKGLVKEYHYDSKENLISGCMEEMTRVRKFLSGGFMEIAIEKLSKEIAEELAVQYNVPYVVKRNVEVSLFGKIQNEFDVVILFGGVLYIIEVKSGKHFRDFSKYYKIGQKYGISPKRILLLDSQLEEKEANLAEYFAEYHVASLGNFREKLRQMIQTDMEVKKFA